MKYFDIAKYFLNEKNNEAEYNAFLDLPSVFSGKVHHSRILVYLLCLLIFTEILSSIGMTRGCPKVPYSPQSGSKRKEMVQIGSPALLKAKGHV